ncbi:hypothetical protein PVAR5_7611 [Paecilomyces variotii No. 5]|uniref:NADH-cytochrome b5 reductase n=1 Tax=Byssochlamys spectabilis (strain No. 5 / NBRC 109023) TaxID=1356009 RepID=V5G3C8_BYSSN|nr:hypothetical protein PVAR5_7611 [Paecilomyces variotii No. 5]
MSLRRGVLLSRLTTIRSVLGFAGLGLYTITSIPTAHASSGEPDAVFSRFGFKSLRVQSVQTVNDNTKRLVFEFPDPDARSGLSLTSALLTIMRPEGRWLPVLRPYTPISDLVTALKLNYYEGTLLMDFDGTTTDEPGQLELMVKRYPNGKASGHIHSLQPGDLLTFVAPLRGFSWKPNEFRHVYLLAGGAGITPIYQLVRGILKNPDDRTKITLVVGVNREEDRLLRDELDGYAKRFPERFRYLYTISHPQKQTKEESGDRTGYIDEELLRGLVKEPTDDSKVFVCGPPAMEDALVGSRKASGILSRLGFSREQVYRF